MDTSAAAAALAALRLQLEWGVDEALAETPVERWLPLGGSTPSRAAPIAPRQGAISAASPAMARSGTPATRAGQQAAAATTLEELERALAGFEDCGLRATATTLVFAEGPAASGLMLIGDVPGSDEDRAGRPFAGPPGRLLDQMLGSIGLERAALRLAMLVPWRPPGGRPPTESEVALCLPFLLRHIALVRPRRLLLLGGSTARALLPAAENATPRRRPRGAWLDATIAGLPAPIPALVSSSPASLLASAAGRKQAWADLRLLRRSLDQDSAIT